jgi:protein SCO1/2
MRRKNWITLAVATALLATIAAYMTLGVSPARADEVSWSANYFPNVQLTTQEGKKVRFYDDLLKGKIVVINLVFTHCVDVCPLETARLAEVKRMLGDRVGKDIFFYSISIDPKRDTPQTLKEYATKYHTGPGWTFLTGKKGDIDLISKKLGLYSDPAESGRDGHAAQVLIGNEATGQWIRNTTLDNPRFLAVMIGDWMNSWQNAKGPVKSYSEAPPLAANLPQKGEYIFATHCAACHSIGHGDKIGPDLAGVTSRRDHGWLKRFIQEPDRVLAQKDPIALALFAKYNKVHMPNLRLDDALTNSLINYLEARHKTSSEVVAMAK